MPTHPLLASARSLGNPVIEGDLATLVWQGTTAPLVIEDLHNWDEAPQKMQRAGPALWYLPISLPAEAYLEYAFIDSRTGERIPDPFNPNKILKSVGIYNHYFYMPEGKPSPLVVPGSGIKFGSVTRHSVATLDFAVGSQRTIYLYHPPVAKPVPLLFVYDGADYLRQAKLNVIVDNLIAEKRIRPFAMAFVQNSRAARSVEYSCAESTLGLLMECVLPLARENLNLESVKKGGYGIMGASLGGSMALFSALRLPKVFRKVLSQSGAFIAPDYQYVVVDLVRHLPTPDINIWMDAGRLEWLLDGNRQMFALLKEKNYRVKYNEFAGGHNYTAWRNDVAQGLEYLYGR